MAPYAPSHSEIAPHKKNLRKIVVQNRKKRGYGDTFIFEKLLKLHFGDVEGGVFNLGSFFFP